MQASAECFSWPSLLTMHQECGAYSACADPNSMADGQHANGWKQLYLNCVGPLVVSYTAVLQAQCA